VAAVALLLVLGAWLTFVLTGNSGTPAEPPEENLSKVNSAAVNATGAPSPQAATPQTPAEVVSSNGMVDADPVNASDLPIAPPPMLNDQQSQPPNQWGPNRQGMQTDGQEGQPNRQPPSVAVIFQRFDANHDDQLNQDEMPQRERQRMLDADANHDGMVSRAELEEHHRRIRNGEFRPPPPPDQQGGQQPSPPPASPENR
jgi:hypothetical protein